jgi:hypothetical protein
LTVVNSLLGDFRSGGAPAILVILLFKI